MILFIDSLTLPRSSPLGLYLRLLGLCQLRLKSPSNYVVGHGRKPVC